jgi:hypothetical protein
VNWYIKSQEVRGGASHRPSLLGSNSHYETDFGVSSTFGAGNTKISFLKACRRWAFKKPIFIMRIAESRTKFLWVRLLNTLKNRFLILW